LQTGYDFGMRAWVVVVAGVLAMEERPARACSCAWPEPVLNLDARAPLPPDPTLYLFVDREIPDAVAPTIIATQDGARRVVEVDEIFHVDAYAVRRIRIRGTTPGTLEVVYRAEGLPATYEIGPARTPAGLPTLVGVEFRGTGLTCGDAIAATLDLTGAGVGAYQLRGIDHQGVPHVAYFPADQAVDAYGIGVPGEHRVRIGSSGCGTDYLGLRDSGGLRFPTAELVRLGVDGSARVVARGYFSIQQSHVELMPFLIETPLPPPRRPPAVAAPTATWRTGLAAGGGLTVGATLMWILARLRSRARSLHPS